ncbi:hypothetical protein O166_06355, partial [Pseudogulbenkiania ferrooxidans EGD-HP2]
MPQWTYVIGSLLAEPVQWGQTISLDWGEKMAVCLTKCDYSLTSSDGYPIEIWELNVPLTGEFLSTWASRFRQHYCPDVEIDMLREGTGLSRADYLTQLVFPDKSVAPGPGVRAGDFAELLVSDYVEYVLGYWVALLHKS